MIGSPRIAPAIGDIQVPEELREIPAWLIWNFEQHEGQAKPSKMPYWADGTKRHGQQGDERDRRRLVKFEEAREAAIRLGYAGVGFAPLEGFGYTFLDVDNCVGPDGSLPPEIEQIAARTYSEYSPSGKGIRIVLKGDLGNNKKPTTDGLYGFETFSSKGFVTITGNILDACDLIKGPDHIAEVDDHVRNLCEKRFGSAQPQSDVDPDDFMVGREPRLNLTIELMEELLGKLDPDMGREDWIRVGLALHHECCGDDTGFELWDEWSSGGAKYPGTHGLRKDWESFDRRSGQRRKQVTMRTVIDMAKKAGLGNLELNASALREHVQEATCDLPQADGVRTPNEYTGKFVVHGAGDPILHQETEWFIKGVIPKAELIVLYGTSGSGKSFIALDMIAAIAQGRTWQGCRVKKAKAVIIAAEGAGGVGKRIRAYCRHHAIAESDLDVGIVTVPPNVIDQVDVKELAAALCAVQADIFVLDTFAQVTPGANENSSEHMGQALRNIRTITEVTGATALIVHHAGKDATRGARGWSGLRGAADAEIEVSASDTGRLVKITKMKDGDDSHQWGFCLKQIVLGFDADGDDETSCVVEYVAAPPQRTKSNEPKGDTQKKIMEYALKWGAGTPQGAVLGKVVDACVGLIPFENTAAEGTKKPRDQRRGNVTRSLNGLCEKGYLKSREGRLYVPSVGPD
jgi:RecA/RadA recombinase